MIFLGPFKFDHRFRMRPFDRNAKQVFLEVAESLKLTASDS